MSHAVKRKLTTIFCADVVGYSRLMGIDEHGTLKQLKECRELITAFIERHRGRVISWSGDAVLADFASVVEAVQCAVEIQRDLKARNDGKPEGERMEFRIGINLGDVMIEDHDIFGEGVNIAARLQSLATPGGILISGSVHDQVKNKLSLGFNFMGHQQVKNIAEHVPVFVVAHDGAPAIGVARPGGFLPFAKADGKFRTQPAQVYGGFTQRTLAAIADWIFAIAAALISSILAVQAFGDVVEINDLILPLASERTIESDLPSTEIESGGRVVKTTQRTIVERDILGFVTQTVRRTHVDVTINGSTSQAGGAKAGATSEDVLIDPDTRREIGPHISLTAMIVIVYLAMLTLTEGLWKGASPGKSLFGLRVAAAQGETMTLARALVRNAGKILTLLTALVGYLMSVWTRRHQALHDIMADCVVVASRR